ncbi:formimidoylglutamate deiminase [Candidatus Puniceispirillum sp.]|nr:formimidoylglutamate deiminase [Candidatus Puniceispirillum sp.]
MQTIFADTALLPNGWCQNLLIELADSGKITKVTPNFCGSKGGIQVPCLIPAPVNAHSHAFQRAMAGLTEHRSKNLQDSFWTWRELMYRFLDQLTPDHIEAITALVQMEMLESGYATNVEFHYLHHAPDGTAYDKRSEMANRIMAATETTGIGLTILPVHYQYGGCDKRPLVRGQCRFYNDINSFAALCKSIQLDLCNLPGDSVFGVAPHSLRAVSTDSLSVSHELAEGGPFHMHVAEQHAEVKEVVEYLGVRPVEWILENFDAGPNCCFIHCTQMLPHEIAGLAKTGAVVGLCPITEASLGDGIFNGVSWFEAGGVIAIGSDSNIRISLSEELRSLEYSQRLRDHSRAALASSTKSTGRHIFDSMIFGGAMAAGRKTGKIAPGYWADLMGLDMTSVVLAGRTGDQVIDSFIFAGDDRLVLDVWSAGRHLVTEGRHHARDKITENFCTALMSLHQKL